MIKMDKKKNEEKKSFRRVEKKTRRRINFQFLKLPRILQGSGLVVERETVGFVSAPARIKMDKPAWHS